MDVADVKVDKSVLVTELSVEPVGDPVVEDVSVDSNVDEALDTED